MVQIGQGDEAEAVDMMKYVVEETGEAAALDRRHQGKLTHWPLGDFNEILDK